MPSQFREGARRSRLMDRKAARRRRGLDGRNAIVIRITTGPSLRASRACIAVRITARTCLGNFSAWGVTRTFFGLLLAYPWAHWYVLVFLWSDWAWLGRGGFWRKRPSNRSSWAKKFCAGVGIPALNVADNRSASKSLYCHLTALEPCTEAFSKSAVVGRLRAGMALIAALSGSRRPSPPWRLVPRK